MNSVKDSKDPGSLHIGTLMTLFLAKWQCPHFKKPVSRVIVCSELAHMFYVSRFRNCIKGAFS